MWTEMRQKDSFPLHNTVSEKNSQKFRDIFQNEVLKMKRHFQSGAPQPECQLPNIFNHSKFEHDYLINNYSAIN